jgi:hypothetical protein
VSLEQFITPVKVDGFSGRLVTKKDKVNKSRENSDTSLKKQCA